MNTRKRIGIWCMLVAVGLSSAWAAPGKATTAEPLTDVGRKLETKYADQLKILRAEIEAALPQTNERKLAAYKKADDELNKAEEQAKAAAEAAGKIGQAKHGLGIWKKLSIPDATKKIAEAREQLKTAATDAARAAAQKTLEAQEKRLADVNHKIVEAEAEINKPRNEQDQLEQANEAAQAALAKAQADELAAAGNLLADMGSVLASDRLDVKLVKGSVIAVATPRGLAEFAQQSSTNATLVEQLLADEAVMKEMIAAGGARFGKFPRAMEIFTAIQKASPQAKDGVLRRLALATSLEHARPITQNNPKNDTNSPTTVDPVKRYLHYEKAFLGGELDPAFKNLTAWEMRFVVNGEEPDEILAWGREMLRTYRPDHIYNPDYGWRYVSSVRTEVPYGSQNVHLDDPANHQHQNIIRNGGVCGRRAFFGRFILRAFGIPTWGVTQKAHAALSHWTPKGWVVNLGAGFPHSWWDKDDVPLSGTQFLLETQARAHAKDYIKVLRADLISRILGEPAYNERRKVEGGFWSRVAHHQSRILAANTDALGPLGQELAEANEREQKLQSEAAAKADREIREKDGVITIPAVAHEEATGKSASMRAFSGGMQLHAFGGFKTEYQIRAPKAGSYLLTANVATAQTGQKFLFTANDGQPIEQPVPYTIGIWQTTEPVPVTLKNGTNTLHFELAADSRGVTIKDFTLTPVK